jgi:hypothetical protein
MAIRDQFQAVGVARELKSTELSPADARELLSCAVGSPTSEAAELALHCLTHFGEGDKNVLLDFVGRAHRRISPDQAAAIADQVQTRFTADMDYQAAVLQFLLAGCEAQGVRPGDQLAAACST